MAHQGEGDGGGRRHEELRQELRRKAHESIQGNPGPLLEALTRVKEDTDRPAQLLKRGAVQSD
jgi:hypothetical protein